MKEPEYKPKPTDLVHVYSIVAGTLKIKVNRNIQYRRLQRVIKFLAKRYKIGIDQVKCGWRSLKSVKKFKPAKKTSINMIKKWN
jgi:hypothetical protein